MFETSGFLNEIRSFKEFKKRDFKDNQTKLLYPKRHKLQVQNNFDFLGLKVAIFKPRKTQFLESKIRGF